MPVITTLATFSEIVDLGSDFAYGKVVKDPSGADLLSADTYGALPIRESFEINPSVTEQKKTSEGGTETVTSVNESWVLKYVTQQVSKKVLYDLPKALAGQYVLFVIELNTVNNPVNGNRLYLGIL